MTSNASATCLSVDLWAQEASGASNIHKTAIELLEKLHSGTSWSRLDAKAVRNVLMEGTWSHIVPAFEDNDYAKLLMRAVTGAIYPLNRTGFCPVFGDDSEKEPQGKHWPSVGHSNSGWLRMKNIYDLLKLCWQDDVAGDFFDVGFWRAGASIFAAGIIEQLEYNRKIWLCDSFESFDENQRDAGESRANVHVEKDSEIQEIRRNFDNYGVSHSSVHFVTGFLSDSLPQLNVTSIAILRMDVVAFSSTSHVLYHLYSAVALSGFVIVDNWNIPQCKEAVLDFRSAHNITDEIVDIGSSGIFWRKSKSVDVLNWIYQDMITPFYFIRDEPKTIHQWTPPVCSCESHFCSCRHAKGNFLSKSLFKVDRAPCGLEWRKKRFPSACDIRDGILHASKHVANDCVRCKHIFEFPVFVISNPVHAARREQIQYVLTSAGFVNFSFPRFITSSEVDINSLVRNKLLDNERLERLRKTPWVGVRLEQALSLILNHIQSLESCVQNQYAMCGIFEDDIMIASSPVEAREKVANVLTELPSTADILYLEYCFEYCSKIDCSLPFKHISQAFKPACTAAMIFTKKGARRALRRIKTIFLGLDNMYAELISHGDLEAYLASPAIFFQDGFYSQHRKIGERAIFMQTHKPFSMVCEEQSSQSDDLDLTVIQRVSRTGSRLGSGEAISLESYDTFEYLEWRNYPHWNEMTLVYYSMSANAEIEENFDCFLGSSPVAMSTDPVRLEVRQSSVCWTNNLNCSISVVLIDNKGQQVGERKVKFRPEMFCSSVSDEQIQPVQPQILEQRKSGYRETHDHILKAYVLNVPGDNHRWNRMVKLFQPLQDIKLVRWSPVPLNDPRIFNYVPQLDELWEQQVYSNQLSFKDAWTFFADDGPAEDWALFLEDDIEFHPTIKDNQHKILLAIQEGLELGKADGFVYLGVCNGKTGTMGWKAACCPKQEILEIHHHHYINCSAVELNGIVYQRGCGSCIHAYAMTRWRAKTLYETVVPFPNKYGHPESIYLDFNIRMWNSLESGLEVNVPLWVVGSNLISPVNPTHFGILFQGWEDSKDGIQFSGVQYPPHVYQTRLAEMRSG